MKKLLNILYVQTQGTYLRQEGETVVAERERAVVAQIAFIESVYHRFIGRSELVYQLLRYGELRFAFGVGRVGDDEDRVAVHDLL